MRCISDTRIQVEQRYVIALRLCFARFQGVFCFQGDDILKMYLKTYDKFGLQIPMSITEAETVMQDTVTDESSGFVWFRKPDTDIRCYYLRYHAGILSSNGNRFSPYSPLITVQLTYQSESACLAQVEMKMPFIPMLFIAFWTMPFILLGLFMILYTLIVSTEYWFVLLLCAFFVSFGYLVSAVSFSTDAEPAVSELIRIFHACVL